MEEAELWKLKSVAQCRHVFTELGDETCGRTDRHMFPLRVQLVHYMRRSHEI